MSRNSQIKRKTKKLKKIQKDVLRAKMAPSQEEQEAKRSFQELMNNFREQDMELLKGLNALEGRAMTTWNTLNVMIRMFQKMFGKTTAEFQVLFNETAQEVMKEAKERVEAHVAAMKAAQAAGVTPPVPPMSEIDQAGAIIDKVQAGTPLTEDEKEVINKIADDLPE